MDASARLAAQTFLAALPLLIVLAAFAPNGVKDVLVDSVQALLGEDAIGVLVTLVSATVRMAAWRWLVWLLGWLASVLSLVTAVLRRVSVW